MKLNRRKKLVIGGSILGMVALGAIVWFTPASAWVRISTSVRVYRIDPQLPKAEPGPAAFPIRPYET